MGGFGRHRHCKIFREQRFRNWSASITRYGVDFGKKEPYSDDEGRMRAPGRDDPVRPEKHIEHEPEVERFARTLVEFLSKAQLDKRFDRLVLSASPPMLGLLRGMLPDSVSKTIRGEYNKNMINIPTDSLGSHFTDVIKL